MSAGRSEGKPSPGGGAGSGSPLFELRGVTKRFGAIEVLKRIDLALWAGQVTALLGDNGAGKSTLIKIIAGVHAPSEGELLWHGEPIDNDEVSGPEDARERGVAAVYQDLGLVETLSIARNFFLGRELTSRLLGVPYLQLSEMSRVAAKQLAEIGIRRVLNPADSVAGLSGGERQAIAIARARYFGAKLLILDEPTSALSLRQTEQVLQFVREAAQAGLAVVFITHTLEHAERVSDRFVVIHQGTIVGDVARAELAGQGGTAALGRWMMAGRDGGVGAAGVFV